MCVVARHTKARTWVDGEVVTNLDRALHLGGGFLAKVLFGTFVTLCPQCLDHHNHRDRHRFDDEDDRYQAGKALLGEPGDVANKETAKKSRIIEKRC